MRDDALTFVELVQRDLRDVRWAEPGEIRARARRRSRRNAVVAAVAVLAVVGGSAVAVAAHPGAGPTAAAPAHLPGGGRAEIPVEALLSEGDLPMKADTQLGDSGLGELVTVDATLDRCAKGRGVSVTPVTSRYSRSRTLLRNPAAGRSDKAPKELLAQDVYRMEPASPGQVFADLDRAIQACPTWRDTAMAEWQDQIIPVATQRSWTVVDRDFAGDRSVVVRYRESPVPGERVAVPEAEILRAVVQVGDLVTVLAPSGYQLTSPNDFPQVLTEAKLRDLARTAADRLCVAANPPC